MISRTNADLTSKLATIEVNANLPLFLQHTFKIQIIVSDFLKMIQSGQYQLGILLK